MTVVGDPTLTEGSVPEVQNMQRILASEGVYHGPVDGRFSDQFSSALAQYQRSHGLVVTGTLDFQTQSFTAQQMQALSGHPAAELDPKVRQLVTSTYGTGMASYLSVPELGNILVEAAKAGWSVDRLNGALAQTHYWQTTQQTARAWDQLQVTDPGEARSQLQQASLFVRQQAQGLGINLSAGQLSQLTEDAVRFGWVQPANHGLLTEILVNTLKANPKVMQAGGGYATALDTVKANAADYLVKVDDKGASNLAAKLVQGEVQDKDVADYYARLAKAQHPGLAHVIDSGVTLGQYLDPYRQAIAKEMDLSPDGVDFINDPRWSKLLDYNPDGKGPRMATMDEALQVARSQPEWWGTTNGRSTGASLGLALARGMGIGV